MKVVIDHDHCECAAAASDRCLAATILYPEGHIRYCTAEITNDGQDALTVVVIQDGKANTLVLRDQRERETVAYEGWPAFLQGAVREEPVLAEK